MVGVQGHHDGAQPVARLEEEDVGAVDEHDDAAQELHAVGGGADAEVGVVAAEPRLVHPRVDGVDHVQEEGAGRLLLWSNWSSWREEVLF